jgi:hypothetical protein
MNANPSATAATALQKLESEARRLRAEHAGDRLAQLAIGVDLAVRRFAQQVADRLRTAGRAAAAATR